MALSVKDALRSELKRTAGGYPYMTYHFECSECRAPISSQHQYLKKHSGLCRSCVQKDRPYISAYHQMTANKHKRRIEVTITYEEFAEMCKIPECHYCENPIARTLKRGEKGYRGYFLDRKDNEKPYSVENCVPCCWRCNQVKGNRFTYDQYLRIAAVIKTFK